MFQHPKIAAQPSPTIVDYFLMIAGFSLSLYLIRFQPWYVKSREDLPASLAELVRQLGDMMRLTEGVVLLWPLFQATQSLRGRNHSLTGAEWLWVIAWICVALLTGLAVWGHPDKSALPEWLREHADKPQGIYYMVVAPSMAVLAALFAVIGLVRRTPLPWTHTFSLALVTWPVLPLAGILTLGK